MTEPTPSASDAAASPDATSDAPPADNGGSEMGDAARQAIATLRREARTAAEERDAALKRVQEYEEATGTEVDQLRTKLGRIEKENLYLKQQITERDHSIAARDAAAKFGIPEWADRLKGSTPEELEADAKQMSERVSPARADADLGAGARPGGSTGSSGMDQLIRRKMGR